MNSNHEFKAIAELDLDMIKTKLMHVESGEGWPRQKAEAVEFEYRRFLYLMKKSPAASISPSVDVDLFWHYHILDTQKYAIDCAHIFGYFLHHYPYVGLDGASDAADRSPAGKHATSSAAPQNDARALCAAVAGAAWCAALGPEKNAGHAWCAASTPAKNAESAWCAALGPKKNVSGAWCAALTPSKETSSAWCAALAPVNNASSAWCAALTPAKETSSAWCAALAPVNNASSAWCAALTPAKETRSAWCAALAPGTEAGSAWCAALAPAKNANGAWCAALAPAKAAGKAWCAALAPENVAQTAWCAAGGKLSAVACGKAVAKAAWCANLAQPVYLTSNVIQIDRPLLAAA